MMGWLDAMHHAGLTDPEQPAFTQLREGSIVNSRVNGRVLNYIVHGATQRAGLTAEYPFTSLRSGWIRDSIRSGTPARETASGAGIAALTTVAIHEHRENLFRDNIAGRVGL